MSPSAPSAPRVHDASALPIGTRLGEFELLSLLGIGGFGIVYLAFDHALEREVAVKEYMPASLAGRTETLHVSLRSQSDAETFALGLRSFVNEARLLARFDHPSLLKVLRFWEANGTAYMAMPVMRGRTLKEQRVEQGRAPDEATLRSMVEALLGALERLHGEGVYHRDIAPDNIQIEPDGHPVLLDFGAARRVLSDKTQTLTAILKPAYAPIEQYAETGSVKQGPWTDFYALGATLHFVLMGKPPSPATARAVFDESSALAGHGLAGYSAAFLQMVDWMLAPKPADRPQSVAELRQVLLGERQVPAPFFVEPDEGAWDKTQVLPRGLTGGDDATLVIPRTLHPPAGDGALAKSMAGAAAPQPLAAGPGAPAVDAAVPAPVVRPFTPTVATVPVVRPQPPLAAAEATPDPAVHPPVRGVAAGAAEAPVRKPLWPLAAAAVAALAVAGFVFWPQAAPTAPTTALQPPVAAETASTGPSVAKASAGEAAGLASPAASSTPAVAVASLPAATSAPSAAALVTAPGLTVSPVQARAGLAPAAASPARTVPESEIKAATTAGARPPPRGAAGAAGANRAGTASTSPDSANNSAAAAPVPAALTGAATPATTPATTAAAVSATPAGQTAAAVPTAPVQPARAPGADQALAAPGPESKCGGRNPVMYFVCMERECLRSGFSGHADCQAWRKEAKRE